MKMGYLDRYVHIGHRHDSRATVFGIENVAVAYIHVIYTVFSPQATSHKYHQYRVQHLDCPILL